MLRTEQYANTFAYVQTQHHLPCQEMQKKNLCFAKWMAKFKSSQVADYQVLELIVVKLVQHLELNNS